MAQHISQHPKMKLNSSIVQTAMSSLKYNIRVKAQNKLLHQYPNRGLPMDILHHITSATKTNPKMAQHTSQHPKMKLNSCIVQTAMSSSLFGEYLANFISNELKKVATNFSRIPLSRIFIRTWLNLSLQGLIRGTMWAENLLGGPG